MNVARGPHRDLSMTLRCGAAYDWILGVIILAAPGAVLAWLRFPPPGDGFLFRLATLPLFFFPLVYLAAADDPPGRPWAVRLSVMYRIAGGSFLGALTLVMDPPGGHVYYLLAAVDVGWGLLHATLARK
jgi:hypothetical protein